MLYVLLEVTYVVVDRAGDHNWIKIKIDSPEWSKIAFKI